MKKKTIWILLLLIVIGAVTFFLVGRAGEDEIEETDEEVVEEMENIEHEERVERAPYEYTGDTDFSAFSSETQVVGQESEASFILAGVLENQRDGYHEFVFSLLTEDEQEPYVTASYISALGLVRMDFRGIDTDRSEIGYQQERPINQDGVLRIYRNISGQEGREFYDIGVARPTIFYLSLEEGEEGQWTVTLQVKYPGDLDLDIDLGSEEFSKEDQSIQGVTAKEGALISTYTFTRGTGLLKFVWSTSSTVDNPIPSVSASYNDNDELVVIFESLSSDRVAGFSQTIQLISSITAEVEREGETSTYIFSGMEDEREFKLSGSLSPNQVILEIR